MNDLHPAIIRLLEKRNLGADKSSQLFSWDLKSIPDHRHLNDLNKAALKIIDAMTHHKKIAIYGDYDVDGTTSCALFFHFFKMLKTEVTLIQPSRFVEGYGLHVSSIDQALQMNIDLMITVDCGITNVEAADYAKAKGLDLIITDHHKDAAVKMPDAYAVVNPNRRDESPELHEEFKALAGVGVAFYICVEIKNELAKKKIEMPTLYPLLEFVAIGTICDLAHLNSINLRLVRHGLKSIKETKFPGIRAFFTQEELKAPFIPSDKLAFSIGPLINSKGRLDHPEMALKLLTTDNLDEARFYYDHLVSCNNERKLIQKQVFDEALDLVESQIAELKNENEHTISIVYQPHWHEGVIGIVASKLVESFKVPAVVFTDSEHEGIIKASVRSAGSLDIFNLLKKSEHLFLKFGGHKAAAGLSMPKTNLPLLVAELNRELATIPEIIRKREDFYDIELFPHEITPKLLRELDALGPFGMGHEKPLFKIKNLKLDSFDILKESHVRWNFSVQKVKMKGISFNYIGKPKLLSPHEIYSLQQKDHSKLHDASSLELICSLSINRFNGSESIQLMIDKVEFGI